MLQTQRLIWWFTRWTLVVGLIFFPTPGYELKISYSLTPLARLFIKHLSTILKQ